MKEENKDGVPHFKIAMLGNSGCGKTSLVNRWINDSYSQSCQPTIGANHSRKRVKLPEGPVDLFVWDTAGQEEFQSLMPLYIRNAFVVIITCSIDNALSFESIPKWLDVINSACDPLPTLILAVNKMDLIQNACMSFEDIHSKYDSQFAQVYPVSALTGEGVDPLYNGAAVEARIFDKKHNMSQKSAMSESSNSSCC